MMLLALFIIQFLIFDQSVQDKIPQDFFNADALLPYDFINSINSISSVAKWSLPPSNYVFPDVIVHFLLQVFLQKPIYTLLFFSIYQTFAILISLFYLNLILFKEEDLIKSANLIVSLCLLFFSILIITGKDFSNLQLIFIPAHHGGIIPVIVLCLAILIDINTQKQVRNIFLLASIIILATASDRIFIIQFSIPACIFLLLKNKIVRVISHPSDVGKTHLFSHFLTTRLLFFSDIRNRDKLKVFLILFLATLGGLKLELFLKKYFNYLSHDLFSQLVNNHFNSNHLSLLRIEKWEKVFYAFTSELSMFSFIILFMGICLLPSIIFLQRIKNKLSLVLIFTFLFSTVNTITVILFQYYLDFFSRRYLLASITIPFIFFCIVILLRRPKIILGLCLILLSIILFLVIDKSEGIFSRLTNFQPKSSQCVDSFFEKFHYNKGASDYWIARPTAIFSKNKIFIYPVETDFGIGLWNTNLQEYKPKNFTAPQFFIFRGKQQVNFLEKFGNPSNIFNCSPYEFWIYDSTHPSMIKYTEDMRRNLLLWEKLTGREF